MVSTPSAGAVSIHAFHEVPSVLGVAADEKTSSVVCQTKSVSIFPLNMWARVRLLNSFNAL